MLPSEAGRPCVAASEPRYFSKDARSLPGRLYNRPCVLSTRQDSCIIPTPSKPPITAKMPSITLH
jgi:hypothetical protein